VINIIIGILSDIHEDVDRLKMAFKVLEKNNVDEIVCLGDIVGFSVPYYTYLSKRDANKVVEMIRDTCSIVVIGNHDLYSIRKIPIHRSFFDYPNNWYRLEFLERKRISESKLFLYEDNELSALLTKKNREYLFSLPEYVVSKYENHNVLFSHYAFPDCTGSSTHVINKVKDLSLHFEIMRKFDCKYSFSGNDHFEGLKIFSTSFAKSIGFEKFIMPNELTWVHGPTVSKGTFKNGIMLYDTKNRIIEAIPLHSKTHNSNFLNY